MMKLIAVSVFTILLFSACSCKPKIVEKLVYLECDCPEIKIVDINLTTIYDEDINITYEVLDEDEKD